MLHDARAVANYIIGRGGEEGKHFTHLQIQKLVYFCHAWTLALCKYPLIYQPIIAWEYGPIIEDVFKSIVKILDISDLENQKVTKLIKQVLPASFNENEKEIVDKVYESYADMNSHQLSSIANADTTPWHVVRSRVNDDIVISDTLIEQYYTKIGNENKRKDEEIDD